MTKAEKRLDAVRTNPRNVAFDDLCAAVHEAGFELKRVKGSHRIFRHPKCPEEMLDLQPRSDGKAKAYQVKQFLEALERMHPEQDP